MFTLSHQPHPTIVSQYGSHRGGVHAVRFRPQMKHLVSGGSDCAVYLWSLHCRPNLRHPVVRPYRFLGHNGSVYSVAVSPCDKLVASGSQDRSIRLWLPTVEGKSSVIKGHTGPVRSVNFNHDGRFLLSGSDDKTIKGDNVHTALEDARFLFFKSLFGSPGLRDMVHNIRILNSFVSKRLILSGSDDKSIRLWDVEKHECVQQFQDVLGMVNSVRFHPDNSCIASGNSDHCIQIWDLREGQIVFTLQGHDGSTQAAEFSPSGEYFASGSSDEHVLLWRTNIDFTGYQSDRGHIAEEERILCSACKCVCADSSNEAAGIHCPKRNKTFQTLEGKGTSACDKSALSPPSIKDTYVRGELSDAHQRSEETASKAKTHSSSNRQRIHTNGCKDSGITTIAKTSPTVDIKSFESTLENICHQLGVLTRTVALFEERLSHSEKKLTRLERISSQDTPDELVRR
ncbi:hypothetical protein R1flu_029188 [Riccia fluitans]|uniref:Uncharacterized protein n=1 Tax=Riccia fluitans TaxID=41844 RepID=A0ABD1XPE4_9MARC